MDPSGAPKMNPVNGLALLFVRGVLLWLLVPLAVIAWPVALMASPDRKPALGAFIGWADLNLIAALQRIPLARNALRWTPFKEAVSVTHRVGVLDPA
jgi:hypothetical protein